MIVVEGPDGGGKSTLIESLQKTLGIPVAPRTWLKDSHSGPVPDLCRWVDEDLLHWGGKPLQIYDRYPLISEPIYGSCIRGEVPRLMSTPWMRARTNTFRSMSIIIWCVPPFDVVAQNVRANPKGHMEHVSEEIDAIWAMYSVQANTWPNLSIHYDYTNTTPDAQNTHLISLLRRHISSWRSFAA